MHKSIKEIIRGSFLGVIGRLLSALVNFFSLPLLILFYGKANYGLVGIAMSTNAFLQIINMGVPTGAVKHFSQWIESKDFESLQKGFRSNMFFFLAIGIVNSGILVFLGLNTSKYFHVADPALLSTLIFILAACSFVNWYFVSFQHLLIAYEKLSLVNIFVSLGSILNILAVGATYFFHASLVIFFVIYTTTTLITIPLNLIVCWKEKILKSSYFLPMLHKREFKIIMSYSVGLFAMGILQYLANQIQPVILSTRGIRGDLLVADYRIVNNVTMLISMLGGIFLQNFVPYVTKVTHRKDTEGFEKFIINGTRYLSIGLFFLCMYVCFTSGRILSAYVGSNYSDGLALWLSIWSLGLLYSNNQAISSVILSSGKFRPILIGLAIASAVTLSFSILFVKSLGVGVVAIGYLAYKTIEALFLYGYYLPVIVKVSPLMVLKNAVVRPLIISAGSVGVVVYLLRFLTIKSNLLYLALSFGLSVIVYVAAIYLFEVTNDEKENLGQFIKKRRVQSAVEA